MLPKVELREEYEELLGQVSSGKAVAGVVRASKGGVVTWLAWHPRAVHEVLCDTNGRYSKYTRGYNVLRSIGGLGGVLTDEDHDCGIGQRVARDGLAEVNSRLAGPVLAEPIYECMNRMRRWSDRREPVDVGLEVGRLSLDIGCRVLFGISTAQHLEVVLHGVRALFAALSSVLREDTGEARERALRARCGLESVVAELVRERSRRGARGLWDCLGHRQRAGHPNDPDDIAEALTWLIAMHETIACTVCWSLMVLAEESWSSMVVGQEVVRSRAGESQGWRGSVSDLEAVVLETLRLYPPIWEFSRMATQDVAVCGVRIPEGSTVMLVPFITHRASCAWIRPLEFWPTRFVEGGAAAQGGVAFLPFGAGRRQCLGAAYAMRVVRAILERLLGEFVFHQFGLEWPKGVGAITLRPSEGPLMGVIKRSN